MPAITLGLAEIDERLRIIRRRANAVILQHGIYISGSVVILVAVALIAVGLRASAPTFRIATWGAVALVLGVAAACAAFLRRRWLDPQATAYLTDRRGQLTDRLATILDLRARPRPSRLAPLLVAQALDLGAQWQPGRIVPRPVPRSVFGLLATLLILAATAFMARPEPPRAAPAQTAADAMESPAADAQPQPPPDPPAADGDQAGEVNAPQAALGAAAANGLQVGMQAADRGATEGDKLPLSAPLAALPDQLQNAIRRAFRAEATDQPHGLTAGAANKGNETGENRDGQNGQDSQRRTAAETGKPGAEKAPAPGEHTQPEASKSRQQTAQQGAKGQDPAAPDSSRTGAAPGAGTGTSPDGLMAAKPSGAPQGADAPKTFKLTISSFLNAMEQKQSPPRQQGKRVSATGSATAMSGGQTALSDQQLNDDALRKADIPPEYEEIVRRVYSARVPQ